MRTSTSRQHSPPCATVFLLAKVRIIDLRGPYPFRVHHSCARSKDGDSQCSAMPRTISRFSAMRNSHTAPGRLDGFEACTNSPTTHYGDTQVDTANPPGFSDACVYTESSSYRGLSMLDIVCSVGLPSSGNADSDGRSTITFDSCNKTTRNDRGYSILNYT